MSNPIPYWLSDMDYYSRNDARREKHLAHIELQRTLDTRIAASAADGSYSIMVTRKDLR